MHTTCHSRLWNVFKLCVMPVLHTGQTGGSDAAQSTHQTLWLHGRKTQFGGLAAQRRQSIDGRTSPPADEGGLTFHLKHES